MDLNNTINKLEKYCSFSERCKSDIIKKLYDWKVNKNQKEIINHLIENNYINEKRYALLYSMGKFNSRKWGKIKISNHLKKKGIKEKDINESINEIPETKYLDALSNLIIKKSQEIKDSDIYNKKSKIARYLFQKGYESNLIWNQIETIIKKGND
tara:strand:+ start:831 stop:1295 length:465 start_codon:yes stop_codon:yes gene_type:complete